MYIHIFLFEWDKDNRALNHYLLWIKWHKCGACFFCNDYINSLNMHAWISYRKVLRHCILARYKYVLVVHFISLFCSFFSFFTAHVVLSKRDTHRQKCFVFMIEVTQWLFSNDPLIANSSHHLSKFDFYHNNLFCILALSY